MNLFATDQIWRLALAVIPLAVVVAGVCRWLPCRPSTRHALWLTMLLFLVVAPFLPAAPVPDLASLVESAGQTGASAPVRDDGPAPSEILPTTAGQAPDRATLSSGPVSAVQSPPPKEAGRTRAPRSNDDRPAFGRSPLPAEAGRPGGDLPAPAKPREQGGASTTVRYTPHVDPFLTEIIGPPRSSFPREDRTVRDAPEKHRDVRSSRPEVGNPGGGRALSADAPAAAPAAPIPDSAGRSSKPGVAHPVDAAAGPTAVAAGGDARASDRSGPGGLSERRAWAQWLIQLRAIRDAVMSLPPIPSAVWIGGAVLLVLAMAWRAGRFRRLLNAAEAASPDTLERVREAAATLGLRRPPITLMIDRRIPPMVWCGRQARLLLPAALWDQLDETGRRAVLFHELAHLKRRDHWVCWLGMAVGCLYWWNPVVWWVRRRVREEADLCCDAWVTTLLPTARRAYATALLEAKRFTSTRHPAAPTVGLGVSAIRTRRFARRLTMVMSQQITPKLTLGGVLLACAVAAGSWLAAPTLACPPKEKEAPKAVKPAKPAKPVKAPKAPKAAIAISVPAPPTAVEPPELAASTFEKFMKLARSGDREAMSLEERIELLEKQIDLFVRQLHQWSRTIEVELPELPEMPELPEIPEISEFVVMPPEAYTAVQALPEAALEAYEHAATAYQSALGSFGGGGSGYAAAAPEKLETRTYELPKGMLEALTKLMVREDVPVLVSPGEDKIDVHGTCDQHMIFKAFCAMIRGKEGEKAFELPEGRLEALTELMIREDVPVLVSPGDGDITVRGSELQQLVFEAFVKMITSDKRPPTGVSIGPATGVADAPAKVHVGEGGVGRVVTAPKAATHSKLAREYELKARGQVAELERLHDVMADLEKQYRAQERLYEKIWKRAEEMQEKARRIEEKAEEVESSTDELEGDDLIAAMQKINKLMLEAQQMENEARMLEAQAEAAEARAEAIEAQAEKIEQRIEELEDRIRELEEKFEEQKQSERPKD